jgi:hypothetical protein
MIKSSVVLIVSKSLLLARDGRDSPLKYTSADGTSSILSAPGTGRSNAFKERSFIFSDTTWTDIEQMRTAFESVR